MRLLHQMKQSHLGELLSVDQATVSRWERGSLELPDVKWSAACRLLSGHFGSAQDRALKRLVESSTQKVHLVCDQTHRLLAASLPRTAEWQIDLSELLGKSLLIYASPEILAAEDALYDLDWHEGRIDLFAVNTGANSSTEIAIPQGRFLWERMILADGTPVRLVTTLA